MLDDSRILSAKHTFNYGKRYTFVRLTAESTARVATTPDTDTAICLALLPFQRPKLEEVAGIAERQGREHRKRSVEAVPRHRSKHGLCGDETRRMSHPENVDVSSGLTLFALSFRMFR